MNFQIKSVPIGQTVPHPVAMRTYIDKDLTNLKITMRFSGRLLEPVKAVYFDGNYRIFDGISRYKAAVELGWETIDVELLDLTDKQVEEQYVLRNVKSKRSLMEQVSHAEMMLGVLGKSQGKKRETLGDPDIDNEYGLAGKDRFEIAAAVAGCEFSPSTLRKLISVKDFVENGEDEVKNLGLIEKLESEIIKPHQAYTLMTSYIQDKEAAKSNLIAEALTFVKGNQFQLRNETCEQLSLIPDESVDLTVTSPPYYKQRDYEDGILPDGVIPHGEETTEDEYVNKQVKVYTEVLKKTKASGSLFIVNSDSFNRTRCLVTEKLIIELVKVGWYYQDRWVWKKNQKPQNVKGRLLHTYENILHFTKHPTEFKFREFKHWKDDEDFELVKSSSGNKNENKKPKGWSLKRPLERFKNFLDEQSVARIIESSVFQWSELQEVDSTFRHPAPFPSYIPLLPILMCSDIGDTVLDVYSGTGTTAAVSVQLGRNAIGYDTDTTSHRFAFKRLSMVEENLPSMNDVTELETIYLTPAA